MPNKKQRERKQAKKVHLTRISSILKGLIDYHNDMAEFDRIKAKYPNMEFAGMWVAVAGRNV